jgi:hypothetical protein
MIAKHKVTGNIERSLTKEVKFWLANILGCFSIVVAAEAMQSLFHNNSNAATLYQTPHKPVRVFQN